MLGLSWLLAIAGLVVAYVISLAGAMRTVPQLYWQEALFGIPLPIAAAAIAIWTFATTPRRVSSRRRFSAAAVLALAGLGLLLIAVSYFDQPGGPM